MKPPPDDDTIEMLKTATRGKQGGGRRRFGVTVVVVLALLVAGTAAVIDGNRAAAIRKTDRELQHEIELLQAKFGHITDWKAWFVEQAPGKWGGDEFDQWLADLRRVTDGLALRDDRGEAIPVHAYAVGDLLHARAFGLDDSSTLAEFPELGDQVDAAWVRRFLQATDPLMQAAHSLLDYDCLSPFPDSPFEVEVWRMSVPELLSTRLYALMLERNHDRALEEAVLFLGIFDRIHSPFDIATAVFAQHGPAKLSHVAAELSGHVSPPVDVLKALDSVATDFDARARRILALEVAQNARFHSHMGWDFLGEAKEDESRERRSFSYLAPSLSWNERVELYRYSSTTVRFVAGELKHVRQATEHLDSGGAIHGLLDERFRVMERLPSRQLVKAYAKATLDRDTLALVVAIRLLEHDAPDDFDSAVHALAAGFHRHEVLTSDEGWIVQVRDTPEVHEWGVRDPKSSSSFRDSFPAVRVRAGR